MENFIHVKTATTKNIVDIQKISTLIKKQSPNFSPIDHNLLAQNIINNHVLVAVSQEKIIGYRIAINSICKNFEILPHKKEVIDQFQTTEKQWESSQFATDPYTNIIRKEIAKALILSGEKASNADIFLATVKSDNHKSKKLLIDLGYEFKNIPNQINWVIGTKKNIWKKY